MADRITGWRGESGLSRRSRGAGGGASGAAGCVRSADLTLSAERCVSTRPGHGHAGCRSPARPGGSRGAAKIPRSPRGHGLAPTPPCRCSPGAGGRGSPRHVLDRATAAHEGFGAVGARSRRCSPGRRPRQRDIHAARALQPDRSRRRSHRGSGRIGRKQFRGRALPRCQAPRSHGASSFPRSTSCARARHGSVHMKCGADPRPGTASGANNPVTPEAERALSARGVLCLPDFVTNCGVLGTMAFAAVSDDDIGAFIARRVGAQIRSPLREADCCSDAARGCPTAGAHPLSELPTGGATAVRTRTLALGVGFRRGWVPQRLVGTLAPAYFERTSARPFMFRPERGSSPRSCTGSQPKTARTSPPTELEQSHGLGSRSQAGSFGQRMAPGGNLTERSRFWARHMSPRASGEHRLTPAMGSHAEYDGRPGSSADRRPAGRPVPAHALHSGRLPDLGSDFGRIGIAPSGGATCSSRSRTTSCSTTRTAPAADAAGGCLPRALPHADRARQQGQPRLRSR